jgi:hypothetical protein
VAKSVYIFCNCKNKGKGERWKFEYIGGGSGLTANYSGCCYFKTLNLDKGGGDFRGFSI